MKNLKAVIIYGIIGVLCIAAFAGYFANNWAKTGTKNTSNGSVIINPKNATAASGSSNETQGTTALSAVKGTEAPGKTAAPDKPDSSQPVAASPAGGNHKLTIEEKVNLANIKPNPNPVVGLFQGTDFASVTRKAIENAGGLSGIVKKGDTVVIKPNIGAPPWNVPDITDYQVVDEIVKVCKECGAGKIIIAEGAYTGGHFEAAGYGKIKGVEMVDLNLLGKDDCYQIKPQNSLTGEAFYMPKVYMDADVVISAAKLKTYSLVGATLSLKNVFGVPPSPLYGGMGGRLKLHSLGVEKSIVDLNRIRKPDFAVIDGIIGGEGPGPYGDAAVNSNIIFAGADLVSVDAAASYFMGFKPGEVGHIRLAAENGLGIDDLSKIKVVGGDLDAIKMNFKH